MGIDFIFGTRSFIGSQRIYVKRIVGTFPNIKYQLHKLMVDISRWAYFPQREFQFFLNGIFSITAKQLSHRALMPVLLRQTWLKTFRPLLLSPFASFALSPLCHFALCAISQSELELEEPELPEPEEPEVESGHLSCSISPSSSSDTSTVWPLWNFPAVAMSAIWGLYCFF